MHLTCLYVVLGRLMYACSKCEFSSKHCSVYLKHFSLKHSFDHNTTLSCFVPPCKRSYRSARCLVRHLRSKHTLFYEENFATKNRHVRNVDEGDSDHEPNLNEGIEFDGELKPIIAKQLLKLREFHHLTSAAVVAVNDVIHNIGLQIKAKLISDVTDYLRRVNFDNWQELHNILSECNQFEGACTSLNSQKKLETFAEVHLKVVNPVEQHLISNNSRRGTYQYVPVLETLKYLLQFEDIFSEVVNGHISNDNALRDVCDGSSCKENILFSASYQHLQLLLYFDDFNVVNPLGNKLKKYKLSAFYMTLGNIAPRFRSQNKSIYLVALCRTKLLKEYGYAKILAPVLDDIKKLETEGLTIEKDGQQRLFKGSVLAICCDNLAAHSIGGFNESFVSLKPCRFCNVTLDNLRNGDEGTLRTKEAYNSQCNLIEQFPDLGKAYGLKTLSPLNELSYFHVVNGLPSDISHDIFEGVGKTLLGQVICHCIQSGHFSVDFLNSTIDHFPWKADDKTNKPCHIYCSGRSVEIKQTATQCFCLLRALPLLIGEIIPIHDTKWALFLDFRDIVDFVCMPAITSGQIDFLEDLIEKFIQDYKEVFPESRLTAKFHYLKHYPQEIRLFGPLKNVSTLRFEAKHQEFKNYFKLNRCHKNICKSLAKRSQLKLSLTSDSVNFFNLNFEYSAKIDQEHICSFPEVEKNAFEQYTNDVVVQCFKILKVGQTVYRADDTCITSGKDGDRVLFSKLLYFVSINNSPFAMLQRLRTIEYLAHLHAYVVEECNEVYLKDFNNIFNDSQYLGMYRMSTSLKQCVTLKFHC